MIRFDEPSPSQHELIETNKNLELFEILIHIYKSYQLIIHHLEPSCMSQCVSCRHCPTDYDWCRYSFYFRKLPDTSGGRWEVRGRGTIISASGFTFTSASVDTLTKTIQQEPEEGRQGARKPTLISRHFQGWVWGSRSHSGCRCKWKKAVVTIS